MHSIQERKLNDLMWFDDKASIFDVIGRMEILREEFMQNKKYHGLLPFLEVYYRVTKNVAEKAYLRKNFYQNYKNIEKFDVYFAKLYFDPIRKYILKNEKQTPWKNYLVLSKLDVSPFIKIFSGINSHINSDLAQTIIDLHYTNEHDFNMVNDILREVLPEIFKYLAFVGKDIFGFGGLLLSGFSEYEFEQTVMKWRSNSWKNASVIRKKRIKNYLKPLHIQTENISLEILELLEPYWKIDDLYLRILKLNKLSVLV